MAQTLHDGNILYILKKTFLLADSDILHCNVRIWDNFQPLSEVKLSKAIAKLGIVTTDHSKTSSFNQVSKQTKEGREANQSMD